METTLHSPNAIHSSRHMPSWLFLAAAAGAVNAFAFLTCEQFVSHLSGTVTNMGLDWPHAGIAFEYFAIVISFILGAGFSVVSIQARAWQGKQPRWATPLVIVAIILIGIAVAGHWDAFGRFGQTTSPDAPPVVLLSLLAFAMGLQNAAVATTTGLAVRTTHMTGPATDLGIHLGTAVLTGGKERRSALRGAMLRGSKVVAFMIGAGSMMSLAGNSGYLSLIAPALLVLAAAALSFTKR